MSELPHTGSAQVDDGANGATAHTEGHGAAPKVEKTQLGGTNKRTVHQKDADLALISSLMVKGWTIDQIVAEIKKVRPYDLGRTQVYREVLKVRTKWREEAADIQRNAQAADLIRYNAIERELWAAWEKSKEDSVRQQATQTAGESGLDGKGARASKKVQKTTQSRHGDPAYLRALMELTRDRAKMLGYYAPQKVEISASRGGAVESAIDVTETGISPEERRELLKRTYERTFGTASTGAVAELAPAGSLAPDDQGADGAIPVDAIESDSPDAEADEG